MKIKWKAVIITIVSLSIGCETKYTYRMPGRTVCDLPFSECLQQISTTEEIRNFGRANCPGYPAIMGSFARACDLQTYRARHAELYVREHPDLEASVKEAILDGSGSKLALGMTLSQVSWFFISPWGDVKDIDRTTTEYGVFETWIYSHLSGLSANR